MASTIDEVIILADEEGKCFPFAKTVYEEIARQPNRPFPVKLVPMRFKHFADGEEKAIVGGNVRKRECYFIHDGNKPGATWLQNLGAANNALHFADAAQITDVLPYFMYARQERKDEPRTSITVKDVADIIQKYGNRVMTVDIHTLAIQLAFDIPVDNIGTFPTLIEHLERKHPDFLRDGDLGVMSPDTGGTSRCRKFINMLAARGIRAELIVGDKYRPQAGTVDRDSYRVVGDVKDKRILNLDDLYGSGNTMIMAADWAMEHGAREVIGYATHPVFCGKGGVPPVAKHFKFLMTSDTRYQPRKKGLELISVAKLMGNAIYRRILGESISYLSEVKELSK